MVGTGTVLLSDTIKSTNQSWSDRRLSVTDDRRLGVRNANVSTIFSEMVCMIAKVLFTHFSQVLWDCLNICGRKLFGRMK